MTASTSEARRLLIWGLLGTCSLMVILVTWSLYGLIGEMRGQEKEVLSRVRALGEASRQELAMRDFQQPGGGAMALLSPSRDALGLLLPKQVAVRFGKRLLWAVPQLAPPEADIPEKGLSTVSRTAPGQWVYAVTLEDGRTFMAVFDGPSYARAAARIKTAVAFEVAAALALILFWGLLAWRLYASYQAMMTTMGQANGLFARTQKGEIAPQDMVAMFQQTVSELRQRTLELERLHQVERRRAQDVEAMVKALCENLDAGYLRFDAEGRLAKANADGRRLLGLPTVPLLGESAERTFAPLPEIGALPGEAVKSRSVVIRDEVPGAEGRLLQVTAIPIFSQTNSPQGALLVLRDMTSYYKMARDLRETEALSRLGEVAAGVAHEVRNGLNVLMLQLKLLREDHAELAEESRLKLVEQEIAQLAKVASDLLFYARPLKLEKEPVKMAALLETVADALRGLFPGLKATVEADAGLSADCDPEALSRALLNIAQNAAEAASQAHPGEGRVRLCAGMQEEKGVFVVVEDDGAGIPQNVRSNLFAPFVTEKPGGTGLGLPIARKIAREHGGDLCLCAGETLPGAAFKLTLP
ncbi:MAG: PAS domain-containing protein [Acidobacteria bacterium]|nr:PAS domain-containing protein [Acidobacteriota bacterium]